MKFKKLILNNFGLYRGKHEILLSTEDKEKPIVLIGGLNGAGKTTILDAIKYALYGKFANTNSGESNSYLDTIKEYINRDNKYEGAYVELEIETTSGNESHLWGVQRFWTWTRNYKNLRESINVYDIDQATSVKCKNTTREEQWYEYIQELVPNQISSLFFFDGEKIEEFADPYKASRLLKTAVSSLFGINTLERLQKDLLVFEKKLIKNNGKDGNVSALQILYEEIEYLSEEIEKLNNNKQIVEDEIEEIIKEKNINEQKYKQLGGEFAERRDELLSSKEEKEVELEALKNSLIEEASGVLPLQLTNKLLHKVVAQDKKERESKHTKRVIESLKERDKELLKKIEDLLTNNGLYIEINNYLQEDLNKREANIIDKEYLNNSPDTSKQISEITTTLEKNRVIVKDLNIKIDQLKSDIEFLKNKIDNIPPDEKLKPLIEERRIINRKNEGLMKKLRTIDEDLLSKNFVYERKKKEYLNKAHTIFSEKVHNNNERRFLEYSASSRDTIDEFKRRLIEKNIRKIERYILESFQHLLRKEKFIYNLNIDTDTFALKLHTEDGELITTERLSAGERQLLATAMLWGMARASGKPLPTIIDTPLGRLDSLHRGNLVNLYFPNASHQVILLSTDEEFDGDYYEMIRPYISREYTLQYSDTDRSTIVEEGYKLKKELVNEY